MANLQRLKEINAALEQVDDEVHEASRLLNRLPHSNEREDREREQQWEALYRPYAERERALWAEFYTLCRDEPSHAGTLVYQIQDPTDPDEFTEPELDGILVRELLSPFAHRRIRLTVEVLE